MTGGKSHRERNFIKFGFVHFYTSHMKFYTYIGYVGMYVEKKGRF